jgi:ankyrin repeat protein
MPPKKKGPPKPPAFKLCDEDDVDALRALLSEQPEARDARNSDGWTPLMQAAYAGAEE